MAKKWEAPIILAVDGLPKALGDCIAGSTDGALPGGEYCGCHDGQNTYSDGGTGVFTLANDIWYNDGCSAGGVPSNCFCGTAAAIPF